MKTTLSIIVLLYSLTTANVAAESTPLIGTHGMVIFEHNGQWYASHLPLANSIHSHQIVFSFEFENIEPKKLAVIKKLASQKALITMLPETFDLRQLMQNTKMKFDANIYQGHFERNRTVVTNTQKITVKTILLNTPLTHEDNGVYYLVPTNSDTGLLVHRIAAKPSFDQILGFRLKSNHSSIPSLPVTLNFANPNPLNVLEVDSDLVIVSNQYYLETKDFQ